MAFLVSVLREALMPHTKPIRPRSAYPQVIKAEIRDSKTRQKEISRRNILKVGGSDFLPWTLIS